jgi:cytochrome c oxidase subunit 2
MDRRTWLLGAGALLATGCGGALLAQESAVRVVQIHTKKFVFMPDTVTLARGEPVILELHADDIAMGFRCKQLDLRAAFAPGNPVQLRLTPETAGRYPFYCDVFCGDGHEDMDGHIIVS